MCCMQSVCVRGFILLCMLVAMCASEPSPLRDCCLDVFQHLGTTCTKADVLLCARHHDDRNVGVLSLSKALLPLHRLVL